MNDMRDAFERLAGRGEHRGAEVVADNVEAGLRPKRGPVASARVMSAVAALSLVVVALAAVWLSDDEPAEVVAAGPASEMLTTLAPEPPATIPNPTRFAGEGSTTTAPPTNERPVSPIDPSGPAPETTTIVIETTTTTPTTAPDFARPPPATITGSSGSVKMEQGSYCWSGGPGEPGLCADTIPPGDQTPAISVAPGEALSVRWETDDGPNKDVQLSIRRVDGGGNEQRTSPAANPTTFVADLAPGSYYLIVFSLWSEGDSSNFVRLDVS